MGDRQNGIMFRVMAEELRRCAKEVEKTLQEPIDDYSGTL